ncbi:MAG: hypothetical protein ACOCRX_04740 [Candidatus Woesearchaeota archaeon]
MEEINYKKYFKRSLENEINTKLYHEPLDDSDLVLYLLDKYPIIKSINFFDSREIEIILKDEEVIYIVLD